jgi:hypothetical protein
VLPLVLTVLGITDFTGSGAPHLTPNHVAFLVASAVISVVLGAARGATIELYPQQGELWQRYRGNTVALWIGLIASKLVLALIASAAGASAGGGTDSLLLSLGVSLLAEAAIVAPRALSTGLPFATDHDGESDGDRSGPAPARPPLATVVVDVTSTPAPSAASGVDDAVHKPASRREAGERGDTRQWTSPGWSEGLNWLRQQIDGPERKGWSQKAPSSTPTGAGRDRHHDHHHHHHGLTGRS